MNNVKDSVTPSLFQANQFRLAELSVFNWGSFNGLHTATIDPLGTLITGDNGSGKSTFIDGLMALLLPPGKANFNVAAAQGDRSDRNLVSYMRGHFGSAHDGAGTRVKSKREGAAVTGLRALYRSNEGSTVTLAALLWTRQATNALADVKRIYMIAERNLTLSEVLDAFGEGSARELKQWLRSDPSIVCCDENFSNYQENYRRLLRMENKNAPALLARALGLKKIDDLTKLIRELVLEPSTVKDDAKKVVDEFADLVGIHDTLLDTRAQRDHLFRLSDLSKTILSARDQIDSLKDERDGLSIYFGEVCSLLWSEKVCSYQKFLDNLLIKKDDLKEKEDAANNLVERRHAEYLKIGGNRIESLKKEIEYAIQDLNRVAKESSQYQDDVRLLELSDHLTKEKFLENKDFAEKKLHSADVDRKVSQDQFAVVATQLSELQQKMKDLSTEIKGIEARPDSNIDIKFQKLRDELVDSLGMKKEHFAFIGELIDVEEQERPWQGAIERALGGLRTTLLVPSESFSLVTQWLNLRHTGLHVRVQVVREASRHVDFKENGFLKKLVWRDHPYKNWLKGHLNRFDLQCVSTTEELDKTPFSMTQAGLVHLEKGRFEKKDQHRINDRRWWNLGFSNKTRLSLLNTEYTEIGKQLSDVEVKVVKARENWNFVSKRISLLEKIKKYKWEDINAPYWETKVKKLRSDLEVLEETSDDLNQAKIRWEQAKQDLVSVRSEQGELLKKEGEVNRALKDAKDKEKEAQERAASGMPDELRERIEKRVGTLTQDDLDHVFNISAQHQNEIEKEWETWNSHKNSAERSAIGIMSSFRGNKKWEPLTVDWRSDISGLDDYIEHLNQIESEGLPQLVKQFMERLNKHATQSLARIHQRLESERENITERIKTINAVLRRTEFGVGSHLKLGVKKERYPHVRDFEDQVATALGQITSKDHEKRYQQLVKVVKVLEKASHPATSGSLESLRLLDPRYQMSFYAEEIETQTGVVRDVLASSSGKSGGEKESFAGIIVAASLAYVLTPEDQDCPIYSTVFLDEAFSNTAEVASRRVLRVFKELNIHVNLITPYKNLNLARESARSLLIVERDASNHDSHLCEVTWDEIDKKLKNEKNKTILNTDLNLDANVVRVEHEVEPK